MASVMDKSQINVFYLSHIETIKTIKLQQRRPLNAHLSFVAMSKFMSLLQQASQAECSCLPAGRNHGYTLSLSFYLSN